MNKQKEFPKQRKLKSLDGTIVHLLGDKLHNWDGFAKIPQGDKKLGEYHLYGIEKTKDEWKEMRSQRNGLPFYKNQSMKNKLSDYRN